MHSLLFARAGVVYTREYVGVVLRPHKWLCMQQDDIATADERRRAVALEERTRRALFALRPTVDCCESFVLFCAVLSRLRRTWMRRALRGRSSASANRQLHECNDLLKKLETLQAKHKR